MKLLSVDLDNEMFASVEEAVAAAIAVAEPGDEICVHDTDCACDDDGNGCTCEPRVIVVPEERPAA